MKERRGKKQIPISSVATNINDGKLPEERSNMVNQRTLMAVSIVGIALAAAVTASAAGPPELSPKEQLGKALFINN